MKINIKPLLTGATLVIASASNINAVPPKGIELSTGEGIDHPVFGRMQVISHEKDIGYYEDRCNNHFDASDLVDHFREYVLNINSYEEYGINEYKVEDTLEKRIAVTKSGRACLKVITANYMREYDRIKQFCEEHRKALEAYREESLKHTEYVEILRLGEKLKRFYNVEVSPFRTMLSNDVKEKEVSVDDLLKLYERSQSGELETMEVGELLKEVLDLDDSWEVVKKRCDRQLDIEEYYPEALKGFFEQHEDDFTEIRDVYLSIKELEKSGDIKKLISLGKVLEQAYEAETKAENERRFSLIRRKNIPACDFLTLYEHFFDGKSEIKDINGILFHTLTLKKGCGGYIRLASGAPVLFPGWDAKDPQKYYWVDTKGELLTKTTGNEAIDTDETEDEECSSLHHELLHFMNDICWSTQEKIKAEDIFKKNNTLLAQLEKEFDKYNVTFVLGELYDDSHEMWAIYGILYVPDTENKGKGEFYYDPINEADSNGEFKILVTRKTEFVRGEGEVYSLVEHKKPLVRTGHGISTSENNIACIKELNEKKKIYSFYFSEKSREWIPGMF